MHLWDELKPEATAESTLGRIASLPPDSSALLVGHEPGMTMILSLLVSGKGRGSGHPHTAPLSINFKKGGVARLRILSTVPDVRGELRWLATPRQIGCLG